MYKILFGLSSQVSMVILPPSLCSTYLILLPATVQRVWDVPRQVSSLSLPRSYSHSYTRLQHSQQCNATSSANKGGWLFHELLIFLWQVYFWHISVDTWWPDTIPLLSLKYTSHMLIRCAIDVYFIVIAQCCTHWMMHNVSY